MGYEDEVLKIGKRLDKICAKKESANQALDLLNALRKIPIDLDVLQKTRIGMTVNNLRKSVSDEEVASVSKTLIRSWKKLLDAQKDGKSAARDAVNNGAGGDSNGNGSSVKSSDSSKQSSNANGKSSSNDKLKFNDKPKNFSCGSLDTSNSVRLKCREMLTAALSVEFPDDVEVKDEILEDPENLAAKIEDCIFKEFRDTNMKYKNRVRSRVANLKDVKNPDLRLNVLRGQIDASRIAKMTAEEMASAEMKQLRQKFTKEAINDAQMSVTGGTKTDLIKCPKCKKNNVTYNQVQTRSSDEPMTTFCFCNECGKRWKFC